MDFNNSLVISFSMDVQCWLMLRDSIINGFITDSCSDRRWITEAAAIPIFYVQPSILIVCRMALLHLVRYLDLMTSHSMVEAALPASSWALGSIQVDDMQT